MHIENEIKVLDIDIDDSIKLLVKNNFTYSHSLKYRRYIYDIVPRDASSWVRLRTDGDTTTLTFKQSIKDAIDGMKEIEVGVSDFESAHELLEASGYKAKSYQENNRIIYTGHGCEVSIDSWPLIPPYLEIEAKDKETVEKCLNMLVEFSTHKTTSLSTEEVYKDYGIDLKSIDKLKFSNFDSSVG